MGALERYLQLRKGAARLTGGGTDERAGATDSRLTGGGTDERAVVDSTPPVIDTSNAIVSLADLLGPTPAEREAQERKAQEGKAKMAAWTGLFDGLRQLGNLYYTAKGAAPQQFNDPYKQIEAEYQAGRKRADEIQRQRQNYATSMYTLQRQLATDRLNERRLARQEKETSIRQEKANAYTNYQNSLAEKNEVQAAYWKAKADALEQGLPYDIAIKKATEAQKRAQANLANVKAANGGSGQNNYGYKIIETVGGQVVKEKERVPTTGSGSSGKTAGRGLGWGKKKQQNNNQETDW